MSGRDDDGFVARTKALLDESEATLTPEVNQRLVQMRREAVRLAESLDRQGTFSAFRPLVPAGAMTATLSAVVAFWLLAAAPLPSIYEDESQQLAAEEMELLEDLEFVAWMIVGIADESVKAHAPEQFTNIGFWLR